MNIHTHEKKTQDYKSKEECGRKRGKKKRKE